MIWENSHQIQFLLNKNFISQKLFEKINRQYIYKLYFFKFDITTYFRVHEIGVFDVDTSTVEKLEARIPRLKVFKQQFTLRHLKLLDELSFQKILYHFSHFLILTMTLIVFHYICTYLNLEKNYILGLAYSIKRKQKVWWHVYGKSFSPSLGLAILKLKMFNSFYVRNKKVEMV